MKKIPVESCIHCHLCQNNCDFLSKYGIDIGDTEKLRELAYHCFLCGRCTEVCPIHIDGRRVVVEMRRDRAKDELPELKKKYKGAFGEKQHYKFRNWKHVTTGSVFFPGCNFPSLFPKTCDRLTEIFAENGIGTVYDCCGKPVAELGSVSDDERIVREIRFFIGENGITELIFACPNCMEHFGDRLGVKTTSIFAKLAELGIGDVIDEDVKFFVPCPDREQKQWIEDIKPFINGEISCVKGIQCCGLGGHAGHVEPEISQGFADRFNEAACGRIYTYCASCTGRFRRNGFEDIDHVVTKILATNESPDTVKSYVNRVMTRLK